MSAPKAHNFQLSVLSLINQLMQLIERHFLLHSDHVANNPSPNNLATISSLSFEIINFLLPSFSKLSIKNNKDSSQLELFLKQCKKVINRIQTRNKSNRREFNTKLQTFVNIPSIDTQNSNEAITILSNLVESQQMSNNCKQMIQQLARLQYLLLEYDSNSIVNDNYNKKEIIKNENINTITINNIDEFEDESKVNTISTILDEFNLTQNGAIYLELQITQQFLNQFFLNCEYFIDCINISKYRKYFNNLFQFGIFLEYGVIVSKIRLEIEHREINYNQNKSKNKKGDMSSNDGSMKDNYKITDIVEIDKLLFHYLGKCPCCQAMYQSLVSDWQIIKENKMKQLAKEKNIVGINVWKNEKNSHVVATDKNDEDEDEDDAIDMVAMSNRLKALMS